MDTILAVGQDEGLLSSRAAVLRKCNADVVAAKASEALKFLKAQRFDLVVLCHTLSSEDMNEVALLAHQQASDIQVLEILKTTELSCGQSSDADDVALPKPETLVAKVTEMLGAQVRTLKVSELLLSRLG
jgi:CheY-like chemotaxis protein